MTFTTAFRATCSVTGVSATPRSTGRKSIKFVEPHPIATRCRVREQWRDVITTQTLDADKIRDAAENLLVAMCRVIIEPPPAPRCSHCGRETLDRLVNDDDRKPCCRRCVLVRGAPKWLRAAFLALANPPAQQRLYRALASVFHPDVGGDERLMQALNAAKEEFKLWVVLSGLSDSFKLGGGGSAPGIFPIRAYRLPLPTIASTGFDGMPFPTTTSMLAPDSIADGASNVQTKWFIETL